MFGARRGGDPGCWRDDGRCSRLRSRFSRSNPGCQRGEFGFSSFDIQFGAGGKGGGIGASEAALQKAGKKRFGQAEKIQVEIDSKTGEISVVSKKTIVDAVINPKTEVSLQEARQFDSEAEVGDEIGSVIEMSDLGRIAAQTATQVIFP